MSENRLLDYLDHMRQAATKAQTFVKGMSRSEFLADARTQQAVVMSLFVVGETATKIMDQHTAFASANPHVDWQKMRGMRNRIAHGYFDIDLEIVWETVQTALPRLLRDIESIT